MLIQIIFSLLAIAGLYYLNSKLNSFSKTSIIDEQMAREAFNKDFPDNKNEKLAQALFINDKIALFEYENKPAVGLCLALGDSFVNRQLPLNIFTKSVDSLNVSANNCSFTLNPQDITLPKLNINFSDQDPLYYWLLERKVVNHSNLNKQTVGAE